MGTIVVPLSLKPNQDYELSINTGRFQNFTNMKGKPSVPYPIKFRTSDGKAKGAQGRRQGESQGVDPHAAGGEGDAR